MKLILILSLMLPIACFKRLKRLARHIGDDIMIDLVYCPMSKRLKKRDRLSKLRHRRDQVEDIVSKDREVFTSAQVEECKVEDLKTVPVKIPDEVEFDK